MSFLNVDDGFAEHPKVAPLSDAAFRLHVAALCYCARRLTDGKLPAAALELLPHGREPKVVDELIAARLWRRARRRGVFEVHDFLEWNLSREQVEQRREAAANRQRKSRERRSSDDRNDAERRPSRAKPQVSDPTVTRDSRVSHGDHSTPLPATAANAAAADAPPLPDEVVDLRQQLVEARLEVRWDKLAAVELLELVELVELHGIPRLVDAARRSYRPDNPPAFADAWLNLWRSLPDPGERLRVVRTCPEHLVELNRDGLCRCCEADRKAAGE